MACINLVCPGGENALFEKPTIQCYSCEKQLCDSCYENKEGAEQYKTCDFCLRSLCQDCLPVDEFDKCYNCESFFCRIYGECDKVPGRYCNVCNIFVCGNPKNGCRKALCGWEMCNECRGPVCVDCREDCYRCNNCEALIGDCCGNNSYKCLLCNDVYCSECEQNFRCNTDQICNECESN